MANDIKQKIVLEGEQEYNRALAEAKRNLKTLRSELKAETAELGANATAQQKNETKIKSLQKQIKEQEKIVKTYQAALKEVKEKYGDNAEAVSKWEVKLNEARATLANMKNGLEEVGQGFKDVENSASMATVASKSVADTLGKLSDVGGAISDSIEAAFTGLLSRAKETIEAVWGNIVDLAARSNNLVDLAGFWNTDVTKIQKYAGAVSEVSGTLEDLNSLVTKINAGDGKKIAELTGVSSTNYKDQWEYAMAVMDAMSEMTKEQRNAAGFEIFGGRQATKAFDLLNDWKTVLANLDKYDAEQGGYGLSEEELQNMSDLYDKVNGLKASWQSLKDMATVKLFGDLSINIATNAQNILDALLKYMNAGSDAERDAAVAEIEANILAMFEAAKKAIEEGIKLLDTIAEDLKKSDNPTAQALGNLLSGLVDALKWLTEDNMKNVVTALEILAGFWLAGKGAEMGTKIASIVSDIRTIKTFKLPNGLEGGTNPLAGAAGTGSGTSLSVGELAITAAAVTLIAEGFAWAREQRTNHPEEVRGTEEHLETVAAAGDTGLKEAFVEYVAAQKALQDMLDGMEMDDAKAEELYKAVNEAREALNALEGSGELLQAYSDWRQEHSYGNMDWMLPDADWWPNQPKNGGNSGNQDGLTSADAKSMTDAVNKMPNAVAKGVSGLRVVMDGQTVGHIVAPYVSAAIATQIM